MDETELRAVLGRIRELTLADFRVRGRNWAGASVDVSAPMTGGEWSVGIERLDWAARGTMDREDYIGARGPTLLAALGALEVAVRERLERDRPLREDKERRRAAAIARPAQAGGFQW